MARSDRRRVLFGVALASALPLVVACNNILGLTDFEKTECSGGRCGDGSILPDVEVDVFDGGVIDAQDESTGATAAVWPQWPMPNYDGGTDFLPNPILYSSSSPVTDGVTGLVWQPKTSGGSVVTYADAENACAALPGGPWRLPKRIELVSLLDFGRSAPFIDPRFTVPKLAVWTSSQQKPLKPTAPSYWTVDFGTGLVAVSPSTDSDVHAALCVKGK